MTDGRAILANRAVLPRAWMIDFAGSAQYVTRSTCAVIRARVAARSLRSHILAWGLRFYVGGTIVTDSGELDIDEICSEAGFSQQLPFLEGRLLRQIKKR